MKKIPISTLIAVLAITLSLGAVNLVSQTTSLSQATEKDKAPCGGKCGEGKCNSGK